MNFIRILPLILAVLLGACGPREGAPVPVRVGGKNFTEQLLLAEITAQHLERAGFPVCRVPGMGGTALIHQALVSGAVDVYIEYTGTAWQVNLGEPLGPLDRLRTRYTERFDCRILDPLGFHNGYAFLARTPASGTLDDLARTAPRLRAGFNAEFLGRPDGWPLARTAYGLAFKDLTSLDAGLIYPALDAGKVDVAVGFTTDGRLASGNYHVFDDNKSAFPRYEAVPVVRAATLARQPGLEAALRALAGRIDEAAMRRMNHAAETGRQPIPAIAEAFLNSPHANTSGK